MTEQNPKREADADPFVSLPACPDSDREHNWQRFGIFSDIARTKFDAYPVPNSNPRNITLDEVEFERLRYLKRRPHILLS